MGVNQGGGRKKEQKREEKRLGKCGAAEALRGGRVRSG